MTSRVSYGICNTFHFLYILALSMTAQSPTILPVILSGGSGTRLWPLSREASPKPFIPLPDGESLLIKAFKRAALPSVTEMLILTRDDLYFRTKDHFEASGLSSAINPTYILEPFGRNTGAAIMVATQYAQRHYGDDVILLFLSADHFILDQEGFVMSVAHAIEVASRGYLTTFGITPTYPEIGYGYIEQGVPIADSEGYTVQRFTEKPDLATAQTFIAEGKYLWNAGIFCFRASAFLAEATLVAPLLTQHVAQTISATDITSSPIRLDSASFEKVEDISIDVAVMEHSQKVAVIPATFDWRDVGSWNAMSELTEKDMNDNQHEGEVFSIDTKNTYINSPHRLTATIGITDLIIVDTPDALLIAHKERGQDVKKVAEHLKREGHESYLLHRTVHRPWGTYTILEEGNGFKIKRITVNAGASLSLQSHVNRSEHWVIVHGIAKIINGEDEILLHANEGAFVKAGNKHRLSNPGSETLVMIETQVGGYLGEDDIVRYDDHYGRA